MASKHFILLLLNISLCLSELVIVPSADSMINEGDPLEITCTASGGIDFFYPKNISGLAATSPISVINETANGGSKFIFKRSKTVFGDTGYYGCVEASKNQRKLNLLDIYVTPDTYDEIDIKWIYVYVKSVEHLLITDSADKHIDSSIGSDVVLPCRPTSPEYNVTLSYYTDRPSPILPLGKDLSYDPKIGFTVHDVEEPFDRLYKCEVTEPHYNTSIISVSVLHSYYKAALDMYTDTLQQLTVGKDFSMNCSITRKENFMHDVFHWTTPQQNQPIAKFIKELSPSGENIYKSELIIKNVTANDVGEYKCHFYGSGVIQIAKANLQLHAVQYLNVTLKDLLPLNGKKIELGHNLQRSIRVSAYPFPTFEWLDPKGNKIANDWTPWLYNLNGEKFLIDLENPKVTLKDDGNHTLIITNPAGKQNFTFSISILVKPIIFKPDDIPVVDVLQDDLVSAYCEAEGKPLPTISWEYSNNLYYLTENSPQSSSFKINSTTDGRINTKSTIEVKAQWSGKLVCRGCNEAGCKLAVVKIINAKLNYVDPNRLGSVIKEINVTEGSKITMECSASTAEFPDDLKWYNTTNLLKTDGRVTITETKVVPSHSSQLTITDVQKWDEGNYTCEGTTGGSTVKNHYHMHVNASALFSASIILQLSIMLLSYFM